MLPPNSSKHLVATEAERSEPRSQIFLVTCIGFFLTPYLDHYWSYTYGVGIKNTYFHSKNPFLMWPGPAQRGPVRPKWNAFEELITQKRCIIWKKKYKMWNVYCHLKSLVLKFQTCIYDTSGDVEVFVRVCFGPFHFLAKLSDTITLELASQRLTI